MAKHMPLIERFFQKVDKSGSVDFPDCWFWTGAPTSRKYGSFVYYTKKPAIGAHVASYLLHKGEIPTGMLVCHHCDNPPCVNPEHLFLDTNSGNMKDMFAKNRQPWSSRERTHCRRGHEFCVVGVISRTKSDGKPYRTCRECKKMREKNRRSFKKLSE
jgi:hypothetical protein